MTIDSSVVGAALPTLTVRLERSRLRWFAQVVEEPDPVYTDVEVARTAGHPDLPALPTYLFGLDFERPEPFSWLQELGADLARVLHGEQRFTYHALAYAGDLLTVDAVITAAYPKNGGALDFIERRTEVRRDAEPVATLDQIIIVRNDVVAR